LIEAIEDYLLAAFAGVMKPIIKIGLYIWIQPSWIILSKISKHKIIQTSMIWIVLIPILAKIFEKLPNEVIFYNSTFVLGLPFTWFYLYFASIYLFLGQLYFLLTSPLLYKENSSYDYFDTNGINLEHLNIYLTDFSYKEQKLYSEAIENTKIDIKTLFWKLWHELAFETKFHRLITSLLYLLGFSFLTFILVENLIFVLKLFNQVYEQSSLYTFVSNHIIPLLTKNFI